MVIRRDDRDLLPEGMKLLQRLGRALDALDKGDASAGDDLAAVLRILIDSKDKGNRAILRLAAATGLTLPFVHVSGAPDPAPSIPPGVFEDDPAKPPGAAIGARTLLVSYGNLPTHTGLPEVGQPHAPRMMGFLEWVETPSLLVPSSQRRSESWGSFATLVANTRGSHMSVIYHDILQASDMFGSAGLSLEHYFLRQVGWLVERVLADLLARAGQVVLPRTRALDRWPRMLIWGWFMDTPGIGAQAAVVVFVAHDDGPPVEIMRWEFRGKTYRLFHGNGEVTQTADA